MTQDEFERRFDQAFERAFMETDLPGYPAGQPDPLPSWHNLKQPLNKIRSQRAFRRHAVRAGLAAAALLLGAGLFGGTESAKAIQPLYDSIRAYPGEVYGFFFGRPDETNAGRAKTAPPTGDIASETADFSHANRQETVNEEEAKRKLSFPLPILGYLPTQVTLHDIQLYFDANQDKADHAAYRFQDGDGRYLYVSFRRFRSESAPHLSATSDGIAVRKMEIDGMPALVKTSEDGSVSLQTFRNRILVQVSGNITEKEAIRIVQNLQNDPA